ncbi:MAG: DUF4859 domain-containing protein [Bacteroidaceae bacterium]|nr:DUF4859 domain-containing protein [Bacteroidaceae bacterium]
MKQRLLTAALLLAATLAAWAQNWTAPVDPASGVDPVNGGIYYIKNVGCGQYITGGNSWSTQISVSSDGLPYMQLVVISANNGSYRLKLNGSFTTNGSGGTRTLTNTYLFRDGDQSGFIDRNNQAEWSWVFAKDNNGYYRIRSSNESGNFGNAANENAYAKEPGQAVVFNMTEGAVENVKYIEWEFIPVDLEVSGEDLQLYAARKTLYDEYVASVQRANTVGADISEAIANAETVYTNSNATIAQLEAATTAFKAAVNRAVYAAQFTGTPSNPQDVTSLCLVNPTFDNDIKGWTITVGGQNLQWQQRTDGNIDAAQNWVQITNFIEAWRPAPNALGDGTISQTIYGLPAGTYKLECDAMACLQGGEPSPEEAVENAYIFIQGENSEIREPIKSPNYQPKHWSVAFNNQDSDWLTFGLKVENTTANWISADNFKITFYGQEILTPAMVDLQGVIANANKAVLYKGQESLKSALQTAINDAQTVADSFGLTEDEYNAAKTSLETAMDAYNASVVSYSNLGQFINEKQNAYTTIATQEAAEPLIANLQTIYSEAQYNTAQLQEAMAKFDADMLRAALAARENTVFQSDLTDYLSNMSFANSIDQERYPNTSAEWQNETETTAYCTAYTTAEVWNQPRFNIFREISNMPAGKYVITVQGVYRETANVDNYNNYLNGDISGQAFFYANDQKANLANLASFAATDANSGWADVATNNEGNTVYVINNQSAANLLFNGEYKPETKQATQLRLTVNVAEGETLRFGIKGEELLDNAWVVWSDFRIYAAGTDSPENVTPETSLSNINIVATKEITIKQHPRTDYSSNTVLVDITDYEAKVGYPIDYVKNNLAAALFCGTFVSSESQIKGDVLSNTQTASQLGWWLGACQNELNEETGEVLITTWGETCKYFAEAYSIIEKDEQQPDGTTQKHYYLSCNIGQYPNALTVGQSCYHTAYIIFGNKAYAVKYTLNITDPSTTNFNELEIVGNTSVTMDQGPGYETGEFHLDVDAIASLLDCDVSELKVQYWKDSEYTLLTTNRSAKNDGAWLNADGTLGAFESAPVYVENPTANDYSVFASGNYENLVEVGQTYQVAFFLTNSELTKGYRVNVNINIVEKDYAKALAYIKNSESYRIYATLSNSKYYLTTNGILTDNKEDASLFTFTSVEANGTLYRIGWDLGCAFTNPTLTNGSNGDIVNNGYLNTNINNNRNDWERQVFFYNDEAFAVRATNANSANWGASTYWTIIDNGTLPEAGYSLDAAYVWHLEKDGENEYIDRDEAVAGITGAEGGLDVTQWIVNPTPTSSYEGWNWSATTTFDPGNNVAEYWQQSGASFSQTIPYLPAGYYILTAQAFTRTNMTAYLSMTVGEEENKVELATVAKAVVDSRAQANTWFNEGNGINEVRFQVPTSGEATIKLTADNTTSDYWLVWRGFTLRYVGIEGFDAFDQTLCPALLAEISQKATDASALLEQKMDAEVKTALEALITDAGDLANESYNVLVAFKKALLTGIQNANNSISYYKTLVPYITEAEEIVAKLDKFAAAKEAVAAHLNDMTTAYNGGTVTTEMVETWMGKATALARENMDWTSVDEGTDISFLIQNPHFKFGQYGPNESSTYYGNEESTPGWTLNSGAIKELRAATHNIEAWHQMFDFSQTLPNMPAGVYDLTLQGFVRHDNAEDTDKTYLYAGVSTRAIMQCTDQWNTEPIYYAGVEMLGDDHYDVEHQQEEGPSHWVDNGMTGSYYWFQTVNPNAVEQGGQEGDCYYTNHLKVVLAQDGNFTIGLHCDTNTDWVIWDNFQLKYLGNPASIYTESIYEKLNTLKDDIDASTMPTAATSQQLYYDMSEVADEAIASGKEENCLQAIEALDAAIATVQTTNAKAEELISKTNTISASVAAKHSSDRSVDVVIDEAYTYINKVKVFADVAAIQTLCDNLDASFAAFEAAEFNPDVITTLISELRTRQNEKVLNEELYQEIDAAVAQAQYLYDSMGAQIYAPQNGESYYIYCDNDEPQWYYNNDGTLAVSNSVNKNDDAYLWTCSYDGNYWTFGNKAGGYLGFKEISTSPESYIIGTEVGSQMVVRQGCVTMFAVNAQGVGKYLVMGSDGHFDQSSIAGYNKVTTDYSSDFVFVASNSLVVATNNSDANLKACIDSLTTLCTKADAYHASVEAQLEELPVGKDLTAVLMNPSYNLGETGWVADNMKQQGGATMGCVITSSYESDGVTLSTFAESWNGGGQPVQDASIRQTTRVELPEGTYALDADIITQSADALVQNVFMFILVTDEQTQETTMVKQPIRVNGGQPGHSQMVFNHKGGKLTFGVCYENTNATWVGMDNWKLSVSTAPNATDIAILAQAYEQMKGTQGDVLGWNLETNPTGLAGVIYTNGHVTAIDLAGYGLDGQFPSALLMLPQIEKIDLHNNGLQGSLDASLAALAQMAGTQTPTSVLKKLNISDNDLSGNIGLIGAVCPQLTQLLAADNHISGLMPALPEGIDQSDFSKFDLRNQTVSEPFTFNMAETDMQAFLEATPTLVTYPLLQKQAELVSMELRTLEEDEFEKYNSALLKLSTEGAVISDLDHEYRGPISAQFELTLTEGPVQGSTLMCNLLFAPGDANLSGAVNVFDLQTDINYIFGDEVEMFNFTAADLYVDRNINVQDIVLLVDTIMSQEEETPAGVKSFDPTLIAEEEETETDAQLFWRGHELVLSSKVPVAAADIRLSADDVEWNIPGFNITAKHGRAIIYSLGGSELPAGETVIATSRGGNSVISSAVLSNRKAKPVSVGIAGKSIPTGIAGIDASGQWRIATVGGTLVAQGNGNAQAASAAARLQKGIYIINIEGKSSVKFSIK